MDNYILKENGNRTPERSRIVLGYIYQTSQFLPYFILFFISSKPLLSFTLLIPMSVFLSFVYILASRKYDVAYRNVNVDWKEYFTRNISVVIFQVIAISILIPIEYYSPLVFHQDSDIIGFFIFYVIILALSMALAPLRSFFSLKMKEYQPDISERFHEYATQIGIHKVEVYSIPWAKFKIANAFQMGGFYSFYIFITDYLVENMNSNEIDFVLLHELYHAKRHHLLKMLVSLSVLIFLLATIRYVPFGIVGNPILEIILMLSYLYLLLGFSPLFIAYISRKNESEADLSAVRITRNQKAAISALRKLNTLNLLPEIKGRYRFYQTHPTIERRVGKIEKLNIGDN